MLHTTIIPTALPRYTGLQHRGPPYNDLLDYSIAAPSSKSLASFRFLCYGERRGITTTPVPSSNRLSPRPTSADTVEVLASSGVPAPLKYWPQASWPTPLKYWPQAAYRRGADAVEVLASSIVADAVEVLASSGADQVLACCVTIQPQSNKELHAQVWSSHETEKGFAFVKARLTLDCGSIQNLEHTANQPKRRFGHSWLTNNQQRKTNHHKTDRKTDWMRNTPRQSEVFCWQADIKSSIKKSVQKNHSQATT